MKGSALVAVVLAVTGCGTDNGSNTTPAASTVGAPNTLNTELIAAAWDNDVERARSLIAQGADVNFKDGSEQNAFHIATSEGYVELLELTLSNGADVAVLDSYNGTGLIRAAHRGHVEIIERLVATDIDVNHVNNLGWTALLESVILGDGSDHYVATVTVLLAAGADRTITDNGGMTPLDHARTKGQDRVAAILAP